MATALYRRYRPENFAEMIGQSQVTAPLMTALRTNRVNHAYLFSGPRGCGKTTSARILARCLNCAEGPTDTPCGVCPSCVELSRQGGGSLDVVEIDAASHGGVDDARDIRERAVFAPARDRYKIFIIDEAHMVTAGGFNALLKIVEEPPEHVKFIFATTEPEKVIGTIRSRTHHYPFRLIPPGELLDYVQTLCESEGVTTEPGVLSLAVRAGGGSARDTLSLVDQLIAGSEGTVVEYERAVGLLGFTHTGLLDDVIEALGGHDGSAAFAAVDRVVQTGQDPRRFVEDLLERLRDLIVVSATGPAGAAAVLRGVPEDELQRMSDQAAVFGPAELSRTADVVNKTLNDMTGATSPRLHLEFMVARALVPSITDAERGALTRLERLERRIGVTDAGGASAAPPAGRPAAESAAVASRAEPVRTEPVREASVTPERQPSPPAVAEPSASAEATPAETVASAEAQPTRPASPESGPLGTVSLDQMKNSWQEILDVLMTADRRSWMAAYTATVRSLEGDILTLSFPSANDVASFRGGSTGASSVSEQLRGAIQTVLGLRVRFVARVDGPGTAAVSAPPTAQPPAEEPTAAEPPAAEPPATEPPVTETPTARTSASASLATTTVAAPARPAAPVTEWHTVAIPGGAATPVSPPAPPSESVTPSQAVTPPPAGMEFPPRLGREVPAAPADPEPEAVAEDEVPPPDDEWAPPPPEETPAPRPVSTPAASGPSFGGDAPATSTRYGESVVREVLGATFLEERAYPEGKGY
ncbi:hypothetical protein GCM10022198_25230 [Klugiella xanthotipulae]|uniref:DNA polymerase III subunit gamma/tau n=1 Tax=Klugiella xanthotipulae TaxID=244735 RepID=A0A543HZ08_9MICO|nr:DNA polymerase III subunit gamma and tau [Klugiella xanthotipulae]TQM63586.1 DNA polymerase-3 subunit gamma/tau [Klugiella xanthotipulae]